MHCVLGFLQVASSNSHSFTAWRGSHSAHFPDGETEAWGVKSSPKADAGGTDRAQVRLNQAPFPGEGPGTLGPQLAPGSRGLLKELRPVSRRLLLGAPQSRDAGDLNHRTKGITAEPQISAPLQLLQVQNQLWPLFRTKPCSPLSLAFLNDKSRWGEDSGHQLCERLSR